MSNPIALVQRPEVRELERVGYRGALGVLCRDAVRGTVVADDLVVTAWRAADPSRRLVATRSPMSGIHGFGLLPAARPGLPSTQLAASADGAPVVFPAPPTPESYAVSVVDLRGRYLPVLALVDVPVTTPYEVALHAAVTRPISSGWAVVRGDVRHRTTDAPLGWSVVTVVADQTSYDVVADAIGRFLLVVPYPEALPALHGSPPAGPGLSALTWQLTVRVRYEPDALAAAPGSDWAPTGQPVDPPELGSILGQQPAQIEIAGTLHAELTETLAFGSASRIALPVQPS